MQRFKSINLSKSGCLCFREIYDGDIEDEFREAFRVFDREGHGFITVPDLTEVLQKLGEKLSTEECQVNKSYIRIPDSVFHLGVN